jgi:hypothetical protein
VTGRRPARTRLIAAAMFAIVVAVAAFGVSITVRYRDGLEQRLRADLTSGAAALRAAGTPQALKPVIGSLAAQGISVDLAGISGPGGSLQISPGAGLLTVHEVIPVAGSTNVPATLTGSLAGINRQVDSLEVTEAIGGVIVLALLAALARARWSYSTAPSWRRAHLSRPCERSWPTPHMSSAHRSPRFRRPPSACCEISPGALSATRSKPNSRVTAVASGIWSTIS